MLEVMSCWKVDWTAVGAIATAAATCVALCVVVADSYARGVQRRRAAKVAQILLEEELSQLEQYGEDWQTIAVMLANNSVQNEYKAEVDAALLVPNLRAYLDNKIHLSENVVLSIAAVVALTMAYRKSLTAKNVQQLFEKRGVYQSHFSALTAEVRQLRNLLQADSESCW